MAIPTRSFLVFMAIASCLSFPAKASTTVSVFQGEAAFGSAETTPIKLKMFDSGPDARTERSVTLSLFLMGKDKTTGQDYVRTSILFQSAKLDTAGRTLDAVQEIISGGGTRILVSIACKGIEIATPDYDFQCVYRSSLSASPFSLRLHSK